MFVSSFAELLCRALLQGSFAGTHLQRDAGRVDRDVGVGHGLGLLRRFVGPEIEPPLARRGGGEEEGRIGEEGRRKEGEGRRGGGREGK